MSRGTRVRGMRQRPYETDERCSIAMPHLVTICGSLRRGSYNAALIRAYEALATAGTTLEAGRIDDLPLYNEDVRQAGFPEPVQRLRGQIERADAVLIATPEYNYSMPGVLKNAIDWASRPPQQPFNDKPIALTGASPSAFGSARAQYHLRQCFIFLNAPVLNQPEVMVIHAHERFDANGKLVDQKTQQIIVQQLEAFHRFINRVAR